MVLVDYILNLTIEQQIFALIVLTAFLIQVVYYLIIYLKPFRWKRKDFSDEEIPLSVIICAQNEYENLKNHLPKILEQKYSNYEVIVVNDCSEDDTEILLGEFEQKYPQLRHTSIEKDSKFTHGKKLAVTIGIKSAKNNYLVFTDADCYPVSSEWLKEIRKSYIINKQIILGYGGYSRNKGLLNRIIRFDAFFIAVQYLGFALAGRPYMGVGRNMSYLKQLFFAGKGFSKHYNLLSGDDDLFINDNANKSNTAVVLSKESIIKSIPKTTWQGWAKQKKRHITTGKYYKSGDKFFLSLEPISRFLFYTGLIALFLFEFNIIYIGTIFAVRLLIQLIVIKLNMNKMNEKGFLLLIPFFDVFLPFIYVLFYISNIINSRKRRLYNKIQ
jgi:glycosyltransferase involved in cell wall biosynthesis